MDDTRGGFDLVGHDIYQLPLLPPQIDNFIIHPENPAFKWVGELTESIGPWRAKMRSTYIRWALAINGLEIASEKYSHPQWQNLHKEFVVTSLRVEDKPQANGGRKSIPTIIASWNGKKAAEAHRDTMPMLAAFGLIDMYANIEEFVFDVYRTFLNSNQNHFMQGPEFKELRRLRKESTESADRMVKWEKAWKLRLDSWQKERIYQGLGKTFKNFCNAASLKPPSFHKLATIETWCESIEIIALVRNCLTHGVKEVSTELATACNKPNSMTFDFNEGNKLSIELYHLQGVELFCHQLLTALNISLVEKVYGSLPRPPYKVQ